ncbi:hypothetical protein JDV02_000116 [Purpureocillium takamizusanense]|uniref:Uncharacterized protein n=1 Tax=Purpureocillium takamizusanense TaxID=2060973 RepID=A0A9Q8Q6F1_9HYPO|nr:uncharacterized protein JDV02_000116 [Purpureocillium takamizusanense]UNI13366.1 hypothetical protein JDV02_000116 [Purpureocillium takamizusanense]
MPATVIITRRSGAKAPSRTNRAIRALPIVALALLMARAVLMAETSGPLIERMHERSRFEFRDASAALTRRFYGVTLIDELFSPITAAFALLQFGVDSSAYWQSLVFLTDFAGIYAILLLESSRGMYRATVFRYPILLTFFAQIIPVGLLGPIYYFALSVLAPLNQLLDSPDIGRLDPAVVAAVLPTVFLAYYLPHFGSYWSTSLEDRHWWNWIWQLYGVWGSLLLLLLARSGLAGFLLPSTRSTDYLRISVGTFAAVGTLTHWYAALNADAPLLEALVPKYLLRNPQDGMVALRTIVQYDYVCSFGAVYCWLGYQYQDLKAAGRTRLSWARIGTVAVVSTAICGPGSALLLGWYTRERILRTGRTATKVD